jgi:hypothetical protein
MRKLFALIWSYIQQYPAHKLTHSSTMLLSVSVAGDVCEIKKIGRDSSGL